MSTSTPAATDDVRLFRGNERVDSIDPANRGLAYGDGLFETMRVFNGEVHWWSRHWARLQQGCAVLGIAPPQMDIVHEQASAMMHSVGDGVLKLIVTRGSGGRGYAPPEDAENCWQLSLHPAPANTDGLDVIWCRQTLAVQPTLAGLKHCNRLEQVMARREVASTPADEGLVCSTDGDVIGATAGNVFVLGEDGTWRTPPVDRAGIAGVCRGWLLERAGAQVHGMDRESLLQARAVLVCNAVRGILPVRRLGERSWPLHPALQELQRALADDHPAFALDEEN